MAENNYIKHAFVSPKSDGPDSTLVRPSNWNDGLVFAGGINGQVLVYDNTQDNNMRWTDGPTAQGNSLLITSSTTTPINDMAPVAINPASPIIAVVSYSGLQFTSVGAVEGTLTLERNNANISSLSLVSGSFNQTFVFSENLNPGSYTYTLTLTVTGNANITLGHFIIHVTTLGR